MEFDFSQNRYYSLYNTGTRTSGYQLWNAGTGCEILNREKKIICQFYFSVNNISDTPYQNHLNRLKYLGFNPASGKTGIYNMGRNFSVKLIFPFEWKMKLSNS